MFGNPYYNQQRYQTNQQIEPINHHFNMPSYVQPVQLQPQPTQMNLLGKSVDSIDVVKAMDIPLDGSISYFPLTDGSAIVTKKLQSDGTSKTVVYKPVEEDKKESKAFITMDELQQELQNLDILDINDINDIKDEMEKLKKELKDMRAEFKERKK